MDPISTFGLAVNVLEVVEFSKTFLEVLEQIKDSGSPAATRNVAAIAVSLRASNEKVMDQSWITEDNENFRNLVEGCQSLSEELIALTDKASVPRPSTLFTKVKVTGRTMWNHGRIEEKKARLEALRGQLLYDIVVPMAEKINKSPDTSALDTQTQTILNAINEGKDTNSTMEQRLRLLHQEHAATQQEQHNEIVSILHGISGRKSRPRSSTPRISDKENAKKTLGKILDSLYFDQVRYRYDDIDHAHKGTFEWIYSDPLSTSTATTWSNLNHWARKGSGVYWVTGKAGSGKSTLMKLLATDQRMRDALSGWSFGSRLLVLSFYFWYPGTQLQKSLEGLFRSILLQAIQECPDLGKMLFPDRFGRNVRWDQFPTMHQLKRAFRCLTTEAMMVNPGKRAGNVFTTDETTLADQTCVPLKVALLIDGLDEFDAGTLNHSELSEIFKSAAAKSSTFKAILSSRPENAFEDAFRDFPKLRLHHLTRNDVVKYVNDRLRDHPRMQRLASQSPLDTESLMSEIVETAQGVFLWVRLVVRSLLEGLQNHDEIGTLTDRLRELPVDLEALFSYMIQRVPSRYTEGMSKIFQLMQSNTELQSYFVQRQQERDLPVSFSQPLTATGLHFALLDELAVLQASTGQFEVEEALSEKIAIEAKVKSHCAGLIELSTADNAQVALPRTGGTRHALNTGSIQTPYMEKTENWEDPMVHYIHRSVAEYLRKEDVWNTIRAKTDHLDFNPRVATLRSLVLQAKKCPYAYRFKVPKTGNIEPWDLVDYALELGYLLEQEQGTPQTALLDALETSLTMRCGPDWWSTHYLKDSYPIPCHDNFFALTIHYGLRHYVQARLSIRGQEYMQKLGRPLLDYTCSPGIGYVSIWLRSTDVQMMEALLRNGADPNLTFDICTPWKNLWSKAHEFGLLDRVLPALEVLLKYGADPNACIEYKDSQKIQRRRTILLVAQSLDSDAGGMNTRVERGTVDRLIRKLRKRGAKAQEWRMENEVFVRQVINDGPQVQKKCTIL